MRIGVGETAFDRTSVVRGFREVGRGVLEARRLFSAIAETVCVLLEVWVPSIKALTAIQ